MTSTQKEPSTKSLLIKLKVNKEFLKSIQAQQNTSAVMSRRNLEKDDNVEGNFEEGDGDDEDAGGSVWATRMIALVKNEMARTEEEHKKEVAELRAAVAELQQKNNTLAGKLKILKELEGSDDTIDKLATQLEWRIDDGDRAKKTVVKLREDLDTVKQEKIDLENEHDFAKQEITRLSHELDTWVTVAETLQKENEDLKMAAAKKLTASEAFPSDN